MLADHIPRKEEALQILLGNSPNALAQEGWEFLQSDPNGVGKALEMLMSLGKIRPEHATGAGLIIGLMLHKARTI